MPAQRRCWRRHGPRTDRNPLLNKNACQSNRFDDLLRARAGSGRPAGQQKTMCGQQQHLALDQVAVTKRSMASSARKSRREPTRLSKPFTDSNSRS